jgi:hypothetical protein
MENSATSAIANNNHHHLHGEGHQRPEILASLNGQFRRALMQRQAHQKHHHNSEQRKNERIGKPTLTPIRERQAKADHRPLLDPVLLFLRHGDPFDCRNRKRTGRRSPKIPGFREAAPDIVARSWRKGST